MPLGFALLLCAMTLMVFGIASPIIKPLRMNFWLIMFMLAAMFGLGLTGMADITPEFSIQPALLVPIVFAIALFVRMNWMKQRFVALGSAFSAGFAAYAVQKLMLDNTRFSEPGLLLGLIIAFVGVALGQYRRARLFAGSMGVVFMALCSLAADLLSGGYGVLHLGEGAQFDTAVTALVFTLIFTGIAVLLRRRSQGISGEPTPVKK